MKKDLLRLLLACLCVFPFIPVGMCAQVDSVPLLSSEEKSLFISPEKLDLLMGNLNQSNPVAVLTVDARSLPGEVALSFRGSHRSYFSVSPEIVPGNQVTEVTVSYSPDRIGMHEAYLDAVCTSDEDYMVTLRLRAACIDPDNPPHITLEPESMSEFSASPDETHEQIITVDSQNMPDYIYASLEGGSSSSFRLATTMVMKNMQIPLKVTFAPLEEGDYHDRICFVSVGHDTLYVDLHGVCRGNSPVEDVEGNDLPLNPDNPQVLLQESFESVAHNLPVSLSGWKNVAMEGKRAWWGYHFSDNGDPSEQAVKVTAYDSKVKSGEETPCEMLLVTPPLDFKNASSKYFTFRVMGDLLIEGQEDLLELCYLSLDGEEMYVAPVELSMPNIPDVNGEWFEYHIDLSDQPIDDVFFMGFRFRSRRGPSNTAVYYVDDVSFGRTDLPCIRPSVTSLAFEAVCGSEAFSKQVQVTGENLSEDFRLTIGGPNRSKFTVEPKTLPLTGGSFTVKFKSDEVGVHQAYVKISSRGAADVYVPLSVNNKKSGSDIAITRLDEKADIMVYNVQGQLVESVRNCPSIEELAQKMPKGVYLLKIQSASGNYTMKVHF